MKKRPLCGLCVALAATALIASCNDAAPDTNCAPEGENPFAAKTFTVLGDSYSTFIGAVSPDTNYVWYTPHELEHKCTDVEAVDQIWWKIVADSLNMNLLKNNSFSGSTISNRGYEGADYTDRSFITRQSNLPKSDYVLVFGATNDSWAGVSAGTYDYETFAADSLYTFRPAMALLLKRLKEAQPEAKIVVIINSELRSEITESCMAIADHYDVPYVNLYDVEKQCGHPTKRGQRAIAEQVIRALDRLK